MRQILCCKWRNNQDKNYVQLKEYLSVLLENALLEYIDGNHKFKTTEKGLNYLKMHNEIGELLLTTIKITN